MEPVDESIDETIDKRRFLQKSLLVETPQLQIHWLGLCEYSQIWAAMKAQVAHQLADVTAPDCVWLLHHKPVYTLGVRGRRDGLLRETAIPVTPVDRGGDVTYHGPGQLMVYPLFNLPALSLTGPRFVHELERIVIQQLAAWGVVDALADPQRPGVYVAGRKIASLGLRCKRLGARQVSYHGFALNVAMDLTPFLDINPCGYAGQAVTQVSTLLRERQLPAPFAALEAPEPDAQASVLQAAEMIAQRFVEWHRARLAD